MRGRKHRIFRDLGEKSSDSTFEGMAGLSTSRYVRLCPHMTDRVTFNRNPDLSARHTRLQNNSTTHKQCPETGQHMLSRPKEASKRTSAKQQIFSPSMQHASITHKSKHRKPSCSCASPSTNVLALALVLLLILILVLVQI